MSSEQKEKMPRCLGYLEKESSLDEQEVSLGHILALLMAK